MSECCQVWKLQFNDYPAMNASFNSQIVPVIGGASNDYLTLINKPSINGVTLEGNKTNEQLNISAIENSEIEELLKSFV